MSSHYIAQMVRLQKSVPRTALARAIRDDQPTHAILDLIPWQRIFGKPGLGAKSTSTAVKAPSTPTVSLKQFYDTEFTAILTAAGVATALEIAEVIPAIGGIGPGALATDSAAWAAQNSAKLITGLSGNSRNAVRATITSGIIANRTPDQIALDVERIIGLRAPQAATMLRFGETLSARGVPAREISERLAGIKSGFLRSRANTIARTETINAANGGQQLTWQISQREGVLTDDNVRKVWIVTPDDLLDLVICAPMPDMQENQELKIGDNFTMGNGGSTPHPTAHPNCRCAQGLVVL